MISRSAQSILLSCSLMAAQPPAADPGPSVMAVPIRINLESLFQMAEATAPKVPPGVETWTPLPDLKGTTVFRYNLYREPILFQLSGNQLKIQTMTNYWLELGVKAGNWIQSIGSCGLGKEPYRRAVLGIQAEFGVQPNWAVTLKAKPLDPVAVTPCQLVPGVDITPKVLGGMRDALWKATQLMEQQAQANTLLRQKAEAIWNQVRQPIEVSPGVFLLMNPESIRLAPWRSEGKTLILMPEIQARPTLAFGQAPAVQAKPLPNLEPIPANTTNQLKVRVEADLPFDQATAQLRHQLAGKSFETPKGTFNVLDVRVKGDKGKTLLSVDLKGKVNGTLTLVGVAVYDAQANTILLKDLDFTLESKSWITSFGGWLLHSSLQKTLSEKANWFVDKSFKDLKGTVQQGMNRDLAPGIHLSGTVSELRAAQPEVLTDRFHIEAFMEGQVQVDVTGISGK